MVKSIFSQADHVRLKWDILGPLRNDLSGKKFEPEQVIDSWRMRSKF